MQDWLLTLAQQPGRSAAAARVLFWLGILVLAAVALAVIALLIRRAVLGQDDASQPGFTLGDLRDMHARGELSDQEFEQAKSMVVAQSLAAMDSADGETMAEDEQTRPEDPWDGNQGPDEADNDPVGPDKNPGA